MCCCKGTRLYVNRGDTVIPRPSIQEEYEKANGGGLMAHLNIVAVVKPFILPTSHSPPLRLYGLQRCIVALMLWMSTRKLLNKQIRILNVLLSHSAVWLYERINVCVYVVWAARLQCKHKHILETCNRPWYVCREVIPCARVRPAQRTFRFRIIKRPIFVIGYVLYR